MAKIIVLVGQIASGKSTYSRMLAQRGCVIVNDDAIVSAVHGGDYALYNKSFKPLYKSVENHIAATALAMKRNVVVDRGVNIRRDSRARWVSLAKSFDVECEAVVFPMETPIIHAYRRFTHDPRGHDVIYWHQVARSHADDYVEPDATEGFSTIKFIGDSTAA